MNEIVKYDNYMNNLKFTGFTTTDFNFLMALCSRMRDKETNKIVFSFVELRNITNYKKSNSIRQFVADLEHMNEKLMRVTCKLRTETEIIMFVLFPTFIINLNKQTLTVAVNEHFKFILNELIKNFTRFELKDFIGLQSKYSKTLFRLLKQFKTTGTYEVTVNDFRAKMGCPVAYNNKQFMQNVINPTFAELQNYFQDLQCTVKYEHKRGKPVSGYIFTFKPEQIPKSEPKEIPVEEPAETQIDDRQSLFASEQKKELTQQERDKLVSEFGKETVNDYIERTKAYKSCNYATIRKWILEDKDRKPRSKNQFNNFMQREVTKKGMDDLEQKLLKISMDKTGN